MSGKNLDGVTLDAGETRLITHDLNQAADLCGAIPVLLDGDYDGAVPAVKALSGAIYTLIIEANDELMGSSKRHSEAGD